MSHTLNINNLPTLTWNRLKINSTPFSTDAVFSGNGSPHTTELPEGVEYRERFSAAQYAELETGCGKELGAHFFNNAEASLFTVKKGRHIKTPLVIDFDLRDKSATSAFQIIKAEEGASVTVIMRCRSPKNAGGTQILRTICDAEKNAFIHLVKVQLLGDGFVQVDDIGTTCADGGRVELTHVILGGKETYTGAAGTLPAFGGSFKADTAYLCRAEQKLDMNYVARQIGKKTDCQMSAKGTLRGRAAKTYRGSIDFINGCAGSTGNEYEEVLLLSPDVVNKSIPLILCGEEDIAGEHGSTIGKLGEDTLFYMQSRGIGKPEAEKLMVRAKVSSVASLIPDEGTVELINTYMDEAFSSDE